MRHVAALSILLTILLAALGAPCLAEDAVHSSYEHLKPMEWMIGAWEGSYVAPADVGFIKKGDQVAVSSVCRWTFDKTFMVTDFVLEIEGKRIPDTHEIVGWDAKQQKAVLWLYGKQCVGDGEWTEIAPEKAVLKWSVDGADGKLAGTSYIEKIDEESHYWQARGITLEGTSLPDWPRVTMRRQQGTPPGDLWTAYRDASVGKWLGQGTMERDDAKYGLKKGDDFVFQLEWEPGFDGNIVLGAGKFEIATRGHKSEVRSVLYWDPATEQVRLLATWSNGNVEELLIRKQVKNGFTGTYVANFIGQGIQRSRILIKHLDADTTVLTLTSGPHKGQVLSSWKRQ